MRIKKYWGALLLFPFLSACQSDMTEDVVSTEKPLTITAYLPESRETRAQIKWGTTNPEDGEIFMWNVRTDDVEPDEIFLYNFSNFTDNPDEACFVIQSAKGSQAEFMFSPASEGEGGAKTFTIKKDDILLALYGETNRANFINDPRNAVSFSIGTESNKPQYVGNPGDENLAGMKYNLKMFDVVKVEHDNVIPALHFKHLSAILRVTLRNGTDKDIYPTKFEFKYPGTESFYNTAMYPAVFPDSEPETGSVGETEEKSGYHWNSIPSGLEGYKLRVYGGYDFLKGSEQYTDNIGTTVNGKDNTTDIGNPIPSGQSYDFYLSTVPRIGNDKKGAEFSIHLIGSHDTDHPYTITIENFNKVIEAGKRYWFDLTAIEQDGVRKLVLTSSLNPQPATDD